MLGGEPAGVSCTGCPAPPAARGGATWCPCCAGERAERLFHANASAVVAGQVVRCRDCGLVFKSPIPTDEQLTSLYEDSYVDSPFCDATACRVGANPYLPMWAASLRVLERLSDTRRLCDIGCGAGAFLEHAMAAGWTAYGQEISPRLGQKAARRSGAEVLVGDIARLPVPEPRLPAITMFEVIEHVGRPVEFLRTVRSWLEPGGILVLSTPNHASLIVRLAWVACRLTACRFRSPLDGIYGGAHVLFFDSVSLARALEAAGFQLLQVTTMSRGYTGCELRPGLLLRASLWAADLASRVTRTEYGMLVFARRSESSG